MKLPCLYFTFGFAAYFFSSEMLPFCAVAFKVLNAARSILYGGFFFVLKFPSVTAALLLSKHLQKKLLLFAAFHHLMSNMCHF